MGSRCAPLLRAITFLCLLLAVACAGARVSESSHRPWAAPVSMPGVGNLYRVSDTLYRSEQPTAEGMRELEKLGIRTVIDLRRDHDDTTETAGTRLHVIRIPTDAWDYGIKEEDVSAFLRAAVDPSNAPVLVHCQRGADRTGTMVAAYRIAVEGWDAGEAVAEMTEGPFRFNSLLFWLPRFVRGLDPEKLRAEAGLK